ncbi:MAG: DDE-type integrase/transposase/recombinase [Hyphomicrobiales bacterium]
MGTRRTTVLPSRINEQRSLDFVSNAFTDDRRFRVLAVVDDFSRECLALVADTSLSGLRMTRELDGIIIQRGRPHTIVSYNGTEMRSMAVLKWCQMKLVSIMGIRSMSIIDGTPKDNFAPDTCSGDSMIKFITLNYHKGPLHRPYMR